jgi:predicted dehydrogenase
MARIAVIGYGYWGPNLARNFMETPGAELAAVCDLRPERLALVAKRYPAVRTTADIGGMIKDRSIDAVAIATPVSTHFELARAALEAGKHVLLEKPLTSSSEQGRTLIDLAARKGRVLMVDHTFVYTGAVRKIREMVAAGEVGDLYYYDSVRINLGLIQHDVNVLWDLAVHDLSIMDYLLGRKATGVSATGMSHFEGKPEDVAYLTVFFEGRLIAHIHANWLAPVKIRRTVVSGSRKMVVYDDLEPSEKVKVYDKGVVMPEDEGSVRKMLIGYRAGDMMSPQLEVSEALGVEARHFLDCIRTGERPITDGESGLRVIRILEAAQESMKRRGQFCELK